MKMIHENQGIGEIVSIFPGSVEIFNKYKIDYCCGGHDTLSKALRAKGLGTEAIVGELNDGYDKFINSNQEYRDWRKEKPSHIIKHIIETHHVYTKKELIDIDTIIHKILKVHFKHHGEELLRLHRLFGNLKIELEEHLVKEEENLFPLIEIFEKTNNEKLLANIHAYIRETENEHDAAGDILKEIEKLTNDFHVPEGVCATYELAYIKLEALEKDLFNHIYLENSILFNML